MQASSNARVSLALCFLSDLLPHSRDCDGQTLRAEVGAVNQQVDDGLSVGGIGDAERVCRVAFFECATLAEV